MLALIFDDDEYVERRLVARHRIIGQFTRAADPVTRRGTDNFVVGVDNRIGALADYLLMRMRHRRDLVSKYDLSNDLKRLTDWWIGQILTVAVKELVLDELIAMRDSPAAEIYWMDGVWQAIQSIIDEYHWTRETVAKPHQLRVRALRAPQTLKFDQRPEHGRVRSQRERSGVAPGTSVGGVPYYL